MSIYILHLTNDFFLTTTNELLRFFRFKEVLTMYKVTEKAACGKEQFDDADRKGVCVKKQIP